jgi:large subunit ribosomal protein L7Ae
MPTCDMQERLLKKAEAEKDGKAAESKKPIVVKFGINHITYLVEQARAQLAHSILRSV